MNNKYNRKKLFFIEKKFYYLFILFFIFLVIFIYSYNNINKFEKFLILKIEQFSINFNYNLKEFEITGLDNIEKKEIVKIIRPYLDKSIFLISLRDVSNIITQNNWVKNVNLKLDYKNKIFIEIIEFKPIGIYYFNNKKYYFNSEGKIIDYANENKSINSKFVIFSGQSSNMYAAKLLKILNNYNQSLNNEILQANFINNRRWDIYMKNDLLIKLSENNLEKSIDNYFKLINNLSYDDLSEIKVIDLRNFDKAIIEYK